MSARSWSAVLVPASVLHILLGLSFIRSAGTTFDEPVHLAAGVTGWANGRHQLNIRDHPPLAEMLAGLPVLAMKPHLMLHLSDWPRRLYHYSDRFLHANRVPGWKMIRMSRVFLLLLWTAILFPLIAFWANRIGGVEAAAGAALSAALMPAFLANLPLIATDAAGAVFYFASFLALKALLDSGGCRKRAAALGLAAGCALASKYSMVVLPVFLGAAVLVDWRLLGGKTPPWKELALAAGVALLVLAAVYRFVEFPLYWKGFRYTLGTLQARSSFLLGEHSTTGFALYFPIALFVKTPLAVWALLVIFTWTVLRRWPESEYRREAAWVALPAVVFFAAAATSKTQIGYRHILPMYPFLAVAVGIGASFLWKGFPWGRFAAAGLLLLQGLSIARAHPHPLTYFNAAAGGPSNGWRWLGDSNLDWGQGLPELAKAMKERGDAPVFLSYFGTDEPGQYGLKAIEVVPNNYTYRPERGFWPDADQPLWLAVSATHRQAIYFQSKTVFSWLDPLTPDAVPGNSIFLYDLSARPDAVGQLARLFQATGRPGMARRLAERIR